jgi:hypothetical protein
MAAVNSKKVQDSGNSKRKFGEMTGLNNIPSYQQLRPTSKDKNETEPRPSREDYFYTPNREAEGDEGSEFPRTDKTEKADNPVCYAA